MREDRKVNCLHMHFFGQLWAAQGNGEVFSLGRLQVAQASMG